MPEQTHKQVFALKETRLASRRGHIIVVPPQTPTKIPRALFVEAAKNGCVDYSDEMVAALTSAAKSAKVATREADSEVDFLALAKSAVSHVLLAANKDPELLTSGGVPRLPAVRAAFEELCAAKRVKSDLKITSDLIARITVDLQSEVKPAELEQSRYPDGIPTGDLEGEEVGGVDPDVLERISGEEE